MVSALASLQQFSRVLQLNPLFALSIILLGGFFLGKLAERVYLPEITGFIVAGLIAGPYAVGLIPYESKQELQLLTELALSIIAFTVGSNLLRSTLARVGRSVAAMATGHIVLSFLFVTVGLSLVGMPPSIAMIMGVLAGGSSPGTVVATIQHERASGTFVEQLYGVVAVATAATITIFGIVFSFTPLILGAEGSANTGITDVFIGAVTDVAVSIGIGIVGGFLLHRITRRVQSQPRAVILTLGVLATSTAVALAYGLSTLLLNMTVGTVFINLSPSPRRVMHSVGSWAPPLYAVFFVLAGAKLNPMILTQSTILLLGLTYVLSRIVGSYIGTSIGARVGGADPSTATYLPLCLVPQAGVALGLVLVLEDAPILTGLPVEIAGLLSQTISIMLLAILVKEIVGPPISAFAVRRAAVIRREP